MKFISRRLRDIERHLQDPEFYGSRARLLRRMQEIFSHREDFCAPYRVALQTALEGLKVWTVVITALKDSEKPNTQSEIPHNRK